jgi:RNA polymerase sigma factor (sigma-70 family)
MDEAQSIAAEDASAVQPHDRIVEEIVRKYGRLIRHAIRRAGGSEVAALADDIEQTVVINLWHQVEREQAIAHPASYIFKAGIRETVRAVQRERSRQEAAAAAAVAASRPADPEQLAAARQRREALASALETLAPDRARAVRAHLGGWSVQEIMDLTGWSYQKTRNLVARGMTDLRAALVARGVR